ncbi:MAG: glycine oxidase ThiO [Myxococcales bacterium]
MGARHPSVDCAIVGGGVAGAACALRLAQAGLSVAVVERGEPGAESSWAAAGILGAQMESHGPGPLLALCLASRALHEALAGELLELSSVDVGYRRSGVVELAFDARDEEEQRARFAWQTAAGLRVERLDARRCREKGGSPQARSGLFFPDDGRVDNRLLARALRIAAERQGARFVRAEARAVVVSGDAVAGLALADGRIDAPRAVIAAGAWSALLPGARIAAGAVRPVRGQMIALGLAPPFDAVIRCAAGYAVPRGADRVIVGATVEEAGFDKALTPEGMDRMQALAGALSPALAQAPVVERWAGLRPGSADGLPLLGPVAAGPRGLFVATGHYRNGILLAPITGALVRDLVLGRTPPLDLAAFRPDRFDGAPR